MEAIALTKLFGNWLKKTVLQIKLCNYLYIGELVQIQSIGMLYCASQFQISRTCTYIPIKIAWKLFPTGLCSQTVIIIKCLAFKQNLYTIQNRSPPLTLKKWVRINLLWHKRNSKWMFYFALKQFMAKARSYFLAQILIYKLR